MVVLLVIAILLAIAIPTFLGVTGSANDRATQSNVTNALTELKALYQNGQTYCEANCAAGVVALPLTGAGSIQSSAPEFMWDDGSANVTTGNNIGVQSVDVTGAGIGDGVILAALSSNNDTCWYAADLEATPHAAFAGGDAGNSQFIAAAAATTVGAQWETTPTAQAPGAGVYYSKVPASNGICNAAAPLASGSGAWLWGTSFANAPTN
jgi:type II secretory pathway pseudopilin PulG